MMFIPAARCRTRFSWTSLILLWWLSALSLVRADLIISEIVASNVATLADDDGSFSDWVEIYNPDAAPVDLNGWYLTDAASAKTKWQFPPRVILPGEYLVVFASNKNRRDADRPLHTNFALSAGGEYLGLVRPDGITVASEFAPSFPAQTNDVAYGRVTLTDGTLQTGFLRRPTPGASNGGAEALLLLEKVTFSRPPGVFSGPVTLQLSGADANQQIRYVRLSGPGSALTDVTADSPLYTGALTLESTTLIKAAVFSPDGATRGTTGQAYYLRVDESVQTFSSQLPIMVLDNLGAGALERDGIDHPSWIFGYNGSAADPARLSDESTLATPLVVTVRGSSSADFPKKGYNIRLRDESGNRRAGPLFDLPAYERWALVAPWAFDQNFFNNAFVYELSNRIGRWAPRTRLAEVFFNSGGDRLTMSDHAGIYIITDRIRVEPGRVDVVALSPSDLAESAITGGYVVKIDPPDSDEIGWLTERGIPEIGDTAIVLVAPSADDIAPAQLEYIKGYIQKMENALHADRATAFSQRTYLDYIDRDSWIDHHLLNVLVANPDALHRSAYFTKDRGGKLEAGPVWDFDRALGSSWDERTSVLSTWSGVGGSAVNVWTNGWWGILAQDPEFIQGWIDRWQTLRRSTLSTAALTHLAATFAETIGTEAAAREITRWPDNASIHGSYPAQITYLQSWLDRRTAWIDAQFVAVPAVQTTGGMLTFTAPPGALLAYTLDGTDPRLRGGALAPTALTSREPLTVSDTTAIQVRSFNPDTPPGVATSPWSSAVGGPLTPPLTPASRIVNTSVLGYAGQTADSLIIGFVIADTESKRYLVRGIGPGLAAFGLTEPIPAVDLRVIDASGQTTGQNQGWEKDPAAVQLPAIAAMTGAFPLYPGVQDAALIAQVSAGTYSLHLRPATDAAGSALAELYELGPEGRLLNLSARGLVGPRGPLTLGVTVEGPAYHRLLIRAVGPTLEAFGISKALPDPVLTLYAQGTIVSSHAGWPAASDAAIRNAGERVGAFPLQADRRDAALIATLAPGTYTIEVRSATAVEGTALLELYDLR